MREYTRKYYERNRDKIREQHRQYREENREACREYEREYAQEHRDRKRRYDHQYNQRNRERKRENSHEWRRRNLEYSQEQHQRRYRQVQALVPRTARSGKRWTPAEDAVVQRDDISRIEMACITGRTYAAVQARISQLRKLATVT